MVTFISILCYLTHNKVPGFSQQTFNDITDNEKLSYTTNFLKRQNLGQLP